MSLVLCFLFKYSLENSQTLILSCFSVYRAYYECNIEFCLDIKKSEIENK